MILHFIRTMNFSKNVPAPQGSHVKTYASKESFSQNKSHKYYEEDKINVIYS